MERHYQVESGLQTEDPSCKSGFKSEIPSLENADCRSVQWRSWQSVSNTSLSNSTRFWAPVSDCCRRVAPDGVSIARQASKRYQRELTALKARLEQTETRTQDLRQSARVWERIAVSRDEETKQLRQQIRDLNAQQQAKEWKQRPPLEPIEWQTTAADQQDRDLRLKNLENMRMELERELSAAKEEISKGDFIPPRFDAATQTQRSQPEQKSVQTQTLLTRDDLEALLKRNRTQRRFSSAESVSDGSIQRSPLQGTPAPDRRLDEAPLAPQREHDEVLLALSEGYLDDGDDTCDPDVSVPCQRQTDSRSTHRRKSAEPSSRSRHPSHSMNRRHSRESAPLTRDTLRETTTRGSSRTTGRSSRSRPRRSLKSKASCPVQVWMRQSSDLASLASQPPLSRVTTSLDFEELDKEMEIAFQIARAHKERALEQELRAKKYTTYVEQRAPTVWYSAGETNEPTQLHRAADFEVPELDGSVEFYQRELGAQYDDCNRVTTFPGTPERLTSRSVALLYDRHDWGVVRVTGAGALEFLQNKTTNSFTQRSAKEGCDTVFCTAKGKILDLATAYIGQQGVLLVLSPNHQDALVEQLEKFVFPGDRVEFLDMRSATRIFSLYGAASRELLSLLNVESAVLDGDYATHQVVGFKQAPVIVAKGNELDRDTGFTLIVDEVVSGDVYKNLIDAGAVPVGLEEWETLRVVQGRPSSAELDGALNPFEVNLFHAVALDKGCFLGQESIARVYTKDALRKRLWGIEFAIDAPQFRPGAKITLRDREVGVLTSGSVRDPYSERCLALGLLNCKVEKKPVDWIDSEISVEGIQGVVRELPYMSSDFIDGKGAPLKSPCVASQQPEMDKEARLQAMQERLAAFIESQNQQT